MQIVDVLKACADATRIDILRALGRQAELCVSDLVRACRVSQPKISRHLAYLRREGIVSDRKEGLNVYYRLATLSDPDCEDIIRIVAHRPFHPVVTAEELPVYDHIQREELDVELL